VRKLKNIVMSEKTSFINVEEIRNFFKEKCETEKITFTEKEFEKFLDCCEKDFFQWLSDNYKYYLSE